MICLGIFIHNTISSSSTSRKSVKTFEQIKIPQNYYIANLSYLEELYTDLTLSDCSKLDEIFSGAALLSPPDFYSLANQILPYNENDIEIMVHNLKRDGFVHLISFQVGNLTSKFFSRYPRDSTRTSVEINLRKLTSNLEIIKETIKSGLLKIEECEKNIKHHLQQNRRKGTEVLSIRC